MAFARDDAREPEGSGALIFVSVEAGDFFGVKEFVEGNGDSYDVIGRGG